MNYYEPLMYVVPPEEDGFILKTILQKRMHISRKLLSRLKQTEQGITVNGARRYISIRVSSGDRVEIRMEQEASEDIMPQDLPIEVIYEDDQLLIVNKPTGMIVHPTHGHYINTLANAVVYYWQERGEQIRFRPIHRLDQETSGVVAIAKNPYAHHNISEQMKANQVKKEYIAIIRGRLPLEEGTIDAPIDRDPANPHVRIVTETGYSAVTHYKVERQFQQTEAAQVRLWLQTGRTHQIRVHMNYLGCPLFGDKLYGQPSGGHDEDQAVDQSGYGYGDGGLDESAGEQADLIDRHALHAEKLGFIHPIRKEWMEFHAELPEDMSRLIKYLSSLTLWED